MKQMVRVAGQFFDHIHVGRQFPLQFRNHLMDAGCHEIKEETLAIKQGSECLNWQMGDKAIRSMIANVWALIQAAKRKSKSHPSRR